MLTREALLAAKDLCPKETVSIPELGGDVVIQGLTAKELVTFQRKADGKEENFAFRLLVLCLKDENGQRILNDEDAPTVEQWPGAIVQRLVEVAMRLNGFGRSAENPLPETSSEGSSSD